MKRILAALLAAALCLGLAGCGPAPEPEATPTPTPSATPAAEPAEFALACYPSAGFHPITGTNRTNLNLAGLVYEGLFELDQEFQVHNVLCASYTVSEDGLTWSFRLRPGVTFSDGSALTAADVVSSLEAARTSALYSARFADIGAVSATADGGVTVTLTRANGNLPALLTSHRAGGRGRPPGHRPPTCSPARGELGPDGQPQLAGQARRTCPCSPSPCGPSTRRTSSSAPLTPGRSPWCPPI